MGGYVVQSSLIERPGSHVAGCPQQPTRIVTPSMVECLGRTTSVAFSAFNGDVLMGNDVAMPQRWVESVGSYRGFAAGGGSTGSAIGYNYKKTVAFQESASYAIWLAGSVGVGGIARRSVGAGLWDWTSRVHYGEVQDGGQTNARRTGARLILIDGTTCFVACKRTSGSPAWGIVRSTDSGANWTDWSFATSRNYTALLKSPQYNCIYASADNRDASGNDGVFILTGLASTAAVTRIDNVGSGAPTLADVRDVWVCKIGTTDYVYVVVGNLSGSDPDRGVWLCKVNADPTGGGFSAAASCTWTHIQTPGGADRVEAICGWQPTANTAPIYLMAGYYRSSTNATGTYTLTPAATGATKTYRVVMQRCLDADTASPTWTTVSNGTNVNLITYMTDHAHVLTYTGEQSNENSRFGGTNFSMNDIAISANGQRIVTAGNSTPWLCDNPWDSTPTWRPLSKGLGGLEGDYLGAFVPGTNRFAVSDDDRGMFTFNQFGYSRPEWIIAENIDGVSSTKNAMNGVRLALDGDSLLSSREFDGRSYITTDPWEYDDAFITALYTSARTAPAIYADQWLDSTSTPRYLEVTQTAIYRNGVQVATITPTSSATRANFAHFGVYCWLHIPDIGIYRSINDGVTWTLWWTYSISSSTTARFCGHTVQDTFDPTVLYCAFDQGGVWKVVAADTAAAGSGLTSSVPPGAEKIMGGALPSGTETISAIGMDPVRGDLWACGYSKTGLVRPKLYVLRRENQSAWIEDPDPNGEYAEGCVIPQFIVAYDGWLWIGTASQGTLRRMG